MRITIDGTTDELLQVALELASKGLSLAPLRQDTQEGEDGLEADEEDHVALDYAWKDVPEWVHWMATDLDGEVWGYQACPYIENQQWCARLRTGGPYALVPVDPLNGVPWEESLRHRTE